MRGGQSDRTARRGGEPRYLLAAHAVVVCGETVAGLRAALAAVQFLTNASLIGAWTKSDLATTADKPVLFSVPSVRVSVAQGEGLGAVARSGCSLRPWRN